MTGETRTLQDWYLSINRVYLDRNFHRGYFEIFGHLSEILGGLSLLASDKKKAGVEPKRFVPKAIAWWMALCGKMGVRDVEDLVWWKFPRCCPYCFKLPHDSTECKKGDGPHQVNWSALDQFALDRKAERPASIGGWQLLFLSIYPVNDQETYPAVFARFTEELGELAEALRVSPVAPGFFISEAADVFAWLLHLQNLIELKSGVLKREMGKSLDRYFAELYANGCYDCRRPVCSCRPILPGTMGRLAHDLPNLKARFAPAGVLIPLEEALDLFDDSSQRISIGGQVFPVDLTFIRQVGALAVEFQSTLSGYSDALGNQRELLLTVVREMEGLASVQRVTQENVNQLAEAIGRLPYDKRSIALDVLKNLAAAPWAAALVKLIDTYSK